MEQKYTEEKITLTLEKNYLPYAMSVIVSRALPEIDGFKPSHRKLLYTMYKMGLLNGGLTKSANIVGATMKLNPHGDAAIYETMVRLSEGNGSLLAPFVKSKGNFGKVYSRDMAYAASRYTEAKLAPICAEVFRDIDQDAVDFIDNYDGTAKEPTLLPTVFPNILVSANLGIAVGMACNICGFDLNEVCRTEIAFLKDPDCDLFDTLTAPDFPTGGELVMELDKMQEIYNTGRGSFRVRSKWEYVKKDNIIEVTEIPYTTTIEAIIDKIVELIKAGKLKEINDVRDESGLSGMKIAIDLKRGTDPVKLMQKLEKMTPLMDSFACNFNILVGGTPNVMGIREILDEWTNWRILCVKRRVYYDLEKKKNQLHLLEGLKLILLDLDKAIAIIRGTEEDAEVIPNLMIGFGIDKTQAEFIAEIKLRNINKEYILKRISEVDELKSAIADLEDILKNKNRVKKIIIGELEQIIKKYPSKRRTSIVYEDMIEQYDEQENIDDYQVSLFISREGYAKKITPQSLRMFSEQKWKEGDGLRCSFETTNTAEVWLITNQCKAYKLRAYELDDTKASALGTYLPQALEMDEGEKPVFAFMPGDYSGSLVFIFENGKAAKIAVSSFDTKTRKKLTGAVSDRSPLVAAFHMKSDGEIAVYSGTRMLIFNTVSISVKAARNSQGVAVMSIKKNAPVFDACRLEDAGVENPARYRTRTLPAAGALIKPEDMPHKQLTL